MEDYITDCTYRAAALVLVTGKEPDEYLKIQSNTKNKIIVSMRWANAEDLPVSDLETGKLLVDPVKFRDVHISIKRKVLDVVDGK